MDSIEIEPKIRGDKEVRVRNKHTHKQAQKRIDRLKHGMLPQVSEEMEALEELNQLDFQIDFSDTISKKHDQNYDPEISSNIKQIVFADDQLLSYSLIKQLLIE